MTPSKNPLSMETSLGLEQSRYHHHIRFLLELHHHHFDYLYFYSSFLKASFFVNNQWLICILSFLFYFFYCSLALYFC